MKQFCTLSMCHGVFERLLKADIAPPPLTLDDLSLLYGYARTLTSLPSNFVAFGQSILILLPFSLNPPNRMIVVKRRLPLSVRYLRNR